MKKAAETWDGEWWKLGGGGAVWDGLAYDPDAELVYATQNRGRRCSAPRHARTIFMCAPSM
jgi:glucose dehydrogenase